MKSLVLDNSYYYYPENIKTVEEFVEYCNNNFNSFIKLTRLCDEHCVEPFFKKEETITAFVNISTINEIHEQEITVLPREEYNERLIKIANEKCLDCVNYEYDSENVAENCCDKLCLNGECFYYEKQEEI